MIKSNCVNLHTSAKDFKLEKEQKELKTAAPSKSKKSDSKAKKRDIIYC